MAKCSPKTAKAEKIVRQWMAKKISLGKAAKSLGKSLPTIREYAKTLHKGGTLGAIR